LLSRERPFVLHNKEAKVPHVFMTCQEGVFGKAALRSIQTEIRFRAAYLLSTEAIELTPGDFSFHFLPAGDLDNLAKDLMVIIMAHADKDRVPPKADPDKTAEGIAKGIEAVLASGRPNASFSVSLMLGEMGYYARREPH
jgi:hypothetical protein